MICVSVSNGINNINDSVNEIILASLVKKIELKLYLFHLFQISLQLLLCRLCFPLVGGVCQQPGHGQGRALQVTQPRRRR